LAANDHQEDGGTTYFMPLKPGGVKKYDRDVDNTCCHGTGLENMVRFQKNIFASDGHDVYDNLFYDSQVELPNSEGLISQKVDSNTIVITADLHKSIDLHIRVPEWIADLKVSLNGRPAQLEHENSYVGLLGLTGKAVIKLMFTLKVTIERAPDDASLIAVFKGPDMLAKKADQDTFFTTSETELKQDEQLVPLNTVGDGPYHVYFKVK